MKKKYIFTVILFLSIFKLNAQIIDVITNVTEPTSLALVGNDLYYGQFHGDLNKVDITANPNTTQVIRSSGGLYRSFLLGNYLYFNEWNVGRISKIDVTAVNAFPVDVATNISKPFGIAISGDFLYFSQHTSNKIAKIDLNQTNPTPIIVATGFSKPTGIALIGNDLYIAEFAGNKISKIDITDANPSPTDVVTNLSSPTEIIVNGNTLLVSEFSGNKVIQIDVSNSTPVVSDLVTNINEPTGLFINGADLYISVFGDSKIVKFTSPELDIQALEDTKPKSQIQLFPNPASDFITISEIEGRQNCVIYNILGAEIFKTSIVSNDKINIQNLANGLYLLKFEQGKVIKFIKK